MSVDAVDVVAVSGMRWRRRPGVTGSAHSAADTILSDCGSGRLEAEKAQ